MRRLALLLAFCPVVASAQTASEEADKGYLVELIEDNLSGDTRSVTITGFEGALSSEARIEQLTVADSDGIWLTLNNVALIWNRGALLRGAIDVETLRADEIIVARAPLPDGSPPDAEAQPFALPDLPVSIALDSLAIDRLELGESFLGETLIAQIAGSAALGGGEGTFDLTAERRDGSVGAFALTGAYDNATRVLALDIGLDEGPGGVVAKLIGLPGQPAVGLALLADAPLDDFAAELAISTDGQDRISGDFTLASLDEGQRFSLDVAGDVTTLFAPEYQEFFGPDVSLLATGMSLAEGGVELETLDLSAQSLTLSGTASIGEDGLPQAFDLSGRLAAADGDIVLLPLAGPKTYVSDADLDIQFDAAQSEGWTAEIIARAYDRPGLFIDALTLTGGGLISAASGDVTANLTYAATGLELDDAATATALGERIDGTFALVSTTDAPTEITALTLQGAGLDVSAEATITSTSPGFRIDSTALAKVEDLARFAPLAGIDLGGGGDLTLIATVQPLDGLFNVLLSGQTQNLQTGIAQVDPLLQGDGSLSLQAVRDTEGTRLEGLRIETDDLTLQAGANLTNDGGRGEFDLSLSDIALVDPRLNGSADLAGTVDLNETQAAEFDIVLTTLADRIEVSGTSTPTPDGRTLIADLELDIAEADRFADLAGRQIGGRVRGQGSVVLLADQTRFDAELDLQTQDLRSGISQIDPLLEGPGTWSIAAARTGQTRFRLNRLTGETPWVTLSANGEGDLEAALSAEVELSLPVAARVAPGLPGPLRLQAQVDRGDDLISMIVAQIEGEGTEIAVNAEVAADQDGNRFDGTLSADVASLAPFSALAGRTLSGGLRAQLEGNGLPDLSQLAIVLTADSQDLRVGIAEADKLLRGAGRYAATVNRDGDTVRIPNLSIATPALSINASADVRGATGSASFDARLSDIGLFTDQLSGPVTASGQARRDTGRWGLDVDAIGPGGLTADVDGTVNDDLDLNLDARGAIPLGLANGVLDPRRIDGTARYDLSIRGSAALNSVRGTIETSGARLSAPTLGQALEDLGVTITLAQGTAQVAARGRVLSGGLVQVNGPVNLTAPFVGDLTARLTEINLRDPELYETTVSGAITLQGPLAGGARVGGTVNVFNTEIRVPSSGIGALGSLPDVTHFGASSAVRTTLNRAGASVSGAVAAQPTESGPAYPLDITVNAPNRVFIRGRGLDAELGGQLTLGGTSNAVVPVGQFNLIRGRLDILQQRFEISDGSASLQGDFEPYIRLVAVTEANTGTNIQIIVEGPASEPEVRFESTPELPQDEVLSQLIFGRNLSDISPLQAVQLAAAVGTLAGRGGGGIIDGFRKDLKLDDFDVTTDEAGNAAVRAGAYLSENVYTDVTVSSDGSTEINLNLDITDEITAKGSVDDDGETSIGIFFERDY